MSPDQLELPAFQRASPTSKRAAEHVARSGYHLTVRETVLDLLRAYGPLTQREMAAYSSHERASIASAVNWLAGGKRVHGQPTRPVRIVKTDGERRGCAIYRLASSEAL